MAEPWNKAAHRLGARQRTGDVLVSGEKIDFSSLLLSQTVLQGLTAAGFERPSPIQLKAIPLGRCGLDLIVQAKSGTGKTCVFSTIALDSLILENAETQILVLAPTREIAVQIHSVITAIGMKMEGLDCHVFIGGTPLQLDKARLKKCHVAVGSPGLKQYYKVVNSYPLPHKIFEEKVQHLQELFSKIPFNQALVFSNLHSRAQHLADLLTAKGFPAVCISGSMSQDNRLEAMSKLKQFHCRVLISTDLTSRGIDAEKVNLVINLDIPQDWETYMHRIGRAGRYGTYGLAVTYCCRGEEENMMMLIAQKCNLQLLCLPEPITADLMEDSSSWEVEVTPLQQASSPAKHDGLPHDTMTVTSMISVPESGPGPSIGHMSKTAKSNIKKAMKQKRVPKGPTEELRPGPALMESVQDLPKKSTIGNSIAPDIGRNLSCDIQDGELFEKSWKMTGENLGMNEETTVIKLPKIFSLASFKRKSSLTLTFAELVEDYEQFIEEGLSKHVEIVKLYTGPGEKGYPQPLEETELKNVSEKGGNEDSEPERNDYKSSGNALSDLERKANPEMEQNDESGMETVNPEMETNGFNVWPDRSGSITNSSMRATYGSKSENESFSSRTSSDTEDNMQNMETEPLDTMLQETNNPSNFITDEKKCLSSLGTDCVQPDGPPEVHMEPVSHELPVQEEESQFTKPNAIQENPVKVKAKAKRSKSSRANRASKQPQRSFSKETEEEFTAKLEQRNQSVSSYEEQGYEEYWRSYYQAWQNYYSVNSSPYYRKFCKRSTWMAAYHMHSVYLRELLKP
ncbi:probable ATP-dependent RNA helicase DDX20 isoform X2 [Ambystoma mexicanum]|uniref:probable ATP-dependent RNA helicase DDX20 isoform X2 n=1 Tax=Ambystoma mexicanum TaxID=8296 RepID=UPI0037E912FB